MCSRIRNNKESYARKLLSVWAFVKSRLFVKQTYAQAKEKLRLN